MNLPLGYEPLGGRHQQNYFTPPSNRRPSFDDLMAQLAEAINQMGKAPTPKVTVNVPKPKALNTEGTAVGGSARGVKSKRSEASKRGRRGTRTLNRRQRNSQMQINNLNLA